MAKPSSTSTSTKSLSHLFPGASFCWVLREDRPGTDESKMRVFIQLENAVAWIQVYYKAWKRADEPQASGLRIPESEDHVVWEDGAGAYLHLERAVIEDA